MCFCLLRDAMPCVHSTVGASEIVSGVVVCLALNFDVFCSGVNGLRHGLAAPICNRSTTIACTCAQLRGHPATGELSLFKCPLSLKCSNSGSAGLFYSELRETTVHGGIHLTFGPPCFTSMTAGVIKLPASHRSMHAALQRLALLNSQ